MGTRCPICKQSRRSCPHTWKEMQDKVRRDMRKRQEREAREESERDEG